jgi:hypothetical protein
VVITRQGFSQVVANGFAGLGFADEAPTVHEFPIEMFLIGSDLTPLKEHFDTFVYGLTKWEPKSKAKGVRSPSKVTVQGKDYQDALTNMNNLFLKNMWSDGLPITPATDERVNWILTGTDLSRDKVIGKIMPRGGIATVETLAVSLAIAGGRPEYLPVLIASVEAIMDPDFELERWPSTEDRRDTPAWYLLKMRMAFPKAGNRLTWNGVSLKEAKPLPPPWSEAWSI